MTDLLLIVANALLGTIALVLVYDFVDRRVDGAGTGHRCRGKPDDWL